jgi:oligopeptide transport system permease protein
MKANGLWQRSLRKLYRDKVGMTALMIVLMFAVIALMAGFGLIGSRWSELLSDGRSGPSAEFWFGTNTNGQDIFSRVIYSTKTAFEIGLMVSICACSLGAILGGIAGYRSGSFVDELILWICGCLDCIPFFLFVAAMAFALQENPYAMHIAMISTFWMSTCRYVRGEFIRLKEMEFTDAARAIGVPDYKIILRHLLPNTSHIILVQVSLTFVLAIKTEVILSFLGLGVKQGISWGIMIAESAQEIAVGEFGNFFSASGFMFLLVISFNLFADALQDALDPKKVG